ncbi:MAG: hypothetical protein HN737_13970 [Desulfobacterales bacterium]|jgi:hypothetical protein|nr:hypothetical protein [Desulfobacteraceae bacterium]MBT4363322.1 hypothetical protein [Desulfobacteraceae bacterium]MBT7086699.1 hypothetical protein [Desulfobacterales bacterium]MBT7698502.1 hypothetical protein [Desulfobacterales bacterium]
MLPIPEAKINKKAVRILTDEGRSIIDIEKITREGDKLHMHGMLMGQFDTSVYITVSDFFKFIPIVLKPGPIIFVLLAPFLWLKNRLAKKN